MNRYRLYVDVEIDSDDTPSLNFLNEAANQLLDGLKDSDAFPDLAEASELTHAVYFIGSGVDWDIR